MTDSENLPPKKKAGRPKKTDAVQETLHLELTSAPSAPEAAPSEKLAAKPRARKKPVTPEAVIAPEPVAPPEPEVVKKRPGRPKKVVEPAPADAPSPKPTKARTAKAAATPAILEAPAIPDSQAAEASPKSSSADQEAPTKAFGRRPRTTAPRPSGSEESSFFLTDMAHMAPEVPAPRTAREATPAPQPETTPTDQAPRLNQENRGQRPAREGSERESRRSRGRGRDRKRTDTPSRSQPQAPALSAAKANSETADENPFETAMDDDSSVAGEEASQPPEAGGRGRRGRGKGRNDRQPKNEPQDYGANWCSRRWLEQLERHAHSNDARQRWIRGKVYARRGQVVEIEVGPNGVLAKVQGSRPKPYQVRMELNKLRREAWGRVLIAVASKAQYTARLLAGEMPPEIEQVFASAGAKLFPAGDTDLRCKCSCPDPMTPCKHVAAVYHAMGASLEQDPFLLFSMRGKSKLQFLQDLRDMRFRAQKGAKQTEYSYEELAQMASFWRMGRLNEAVFAHVSFEPGDPARLLHTLGDPPSSVVRAGMAMPVLESTYRQVSESIQRLPKDI